MAAMAPPRCPECRSSDIVTDFAAGDIVCRGCGVILCDRIVDDTAEWRTFADDDSSKGDPSRCTAGPVGAATFLKGGSKAHAHSLSAVQRRVDRPDSALQACEDKVSELAAALSIPNHVASTARALLRQLDQAEEFKRKKGTPGLAMCAAALYVAAKQAGVGRSFGELAPVAGVDKRDVAKAFKHATRHLPFGAADASARGSVRGEHLVPRVCGALGVPPTVSQAARHIAERCGELSLTDGIKPQVVAAAATWLAAVCCAAAGVLAAAGDAAAAATALAGGVVVHKETVAESAAVPLGSMVKLCRVVHEHRASLVPSHLTAQMARRGTAVDALPPP